jgi:hypothetical protein
LAEQRSKPVNPLEEGLDTEFKYIASIRAFETFRNQVRQEGISIPETGGGHISFSSGKRLNMRAYKARGLVWSYSIIRVRKLEDLIEEG